MNGRNFLTCVALSLAAAVLVCPFGQERASAAPAVLQTGANGYYIPDYFTTPNWANSPPLTKFVDGLPGLCGSPLGTDPDGINNLGQCMPVAEPDTTTYPGSDYYEIELVQYRERMHTDLPALNNIDKMAATSGGTLLRGYRQTNAPTQGAVLSVPHYLGPLIIARKYDPNYAPDAALPGGGTNGRPVRIKFTNSLPTGAEGNLFVPVDTTIMGSGPFEIDYDPETKLPTGSLNSGNFPDTRADIHLHGGMTPWISDGTPHQWITPAGETDPITGTPTTYPKGMSVEYVPDMWFDASGQMITEATYPGSNCAGQTTCSVLGATNNPGPGAQTYYYTNQQSARLLFYHDHAWGTTRLNVYVGMAAGYLIRDTVEEALIAAQTIPAAEIPLIIQDKTFVDAATVMTTDPTWAWGSNPAKPATLTPVTGDLWWPHVYMPAQNPEDITGAAAFGRWVYGPYFFPPTPLCGSTPDAVKPFCINFGPVPNPYIAEPGQPSVIPGTPNPSWGAEAFLDTMVVNGTAFPSLTVNPQAYRFRILNAAHDRFVNLQLYVADPTILEGQPGHLKEVKMVPAAPTGGYPATWPTDGREGGVPDPTTRGPAMIQIGTESGFLSAPALLPNQPVNWNTDVTTFNAGNVLQQNEGGGTLMLGPAERGDVIIDFSDFAGKTLILYNDAPAPWPALDPHYDYYTGAPDRTDMGGYTAIPPGVGPNIRTVMQIKVAATGGSSGATPDYYNPTTLTNLQNAFKSTAGNPGVFAKGQEEILVGQAAYNDVYDPNTAFPATYPNWGVARIQDDLISYENVDGTIVTNKQMKRKAIQDEMGEVFDDYGRMSAKLGLEVPFTNGANQNFILQNFVDPPTEFVRHNEVQIWRITHNGVDTHPVHFHIFDVQVLNRVGWDGFIRLPDPNELGWKDTVRISPLEDTIVALRPRKPIVPFAVPDSIRPLNPARPLGDMEGFSQIDVNTGGNLAPLQTNKFFNYGAEYVWHCHILSHEENDMMRNIAFRMKDYIGVFEQGGMWYLDINDNGAWNQGIDKNYTFGTSGDIPVSGDWNASGTTKSGLFRNGTWTIDTNGTGVAPATYNFGVGLVGAVPVTGDWTGTGSTKIGVYVDGTWYLDLNGNGAWDGTPTDGLYSNFGRGLVGAVPVTGDWTGTGSTKIGLYVDGTWYRDLNGNGAWDGAATDALNLFGTGVVGAVPVTGDWGAFGSSKLGIFVPSTGQWYIDYNGNNTWDGSLTDRLFSFGGGLTGALPVIGRW